MNRTLPHFLAKLAGILELCVVSILILVILFGGGTLIADLFETMRDAPRSLDMGYFLADALELIVGIEFVKMLLKHTPGAVVEVLLFAIAREMVVIHTSAFDTLLGVVAVAIIFLIRRFLYRDDPSREETLDH